MVTPASIPVNDRSDTTSVPTRQCGRCRAHFALAEDLERAWVREWWVCPACHASLLPDRATTGPGTSDRSGS